MTLQDEAEQLRKEQEQLLKEREELEKSNRELLSQEVHDVAQSQNLLLTIREDIQGIHSDNEKLKQEIQALGAENALLKQAVNLPEGPQGEAVLKNTLAGLESLSGQSLEPDGSNVIWQPDIKVQREELRGEREELLTERARLRAEASKLCGDLQTNMKEKFPPIQEVTVKSEGPLAGVLEEYGTLCGETTDLQQEHDRLKRELEAAKAEQDPEEEKKERDQLRRELTSQMIRYTFFPPKPEVPEYTRTTTKEVSENNQYLQFKTKNMLGQLLKVGKSSTSF